jgi:hypothetical protein
MLFDEFCEFRDSRKLSSGTTLNSVGLMVVSRYARLKRFLTNVEGGIFGISCSEIFER